jgi:hypothetical protein
MDNISLTGNLEGLVNHQETVELDGQYIMEGDVMKFQADSWKPADSMPTLDGTLEQTDGQIWLVTAEGKRLQIVDPPSDLQLGQRSLVYGIVSDDKLDWRTINQGEGGGGGGGGGGGAGLARLNLSGTPMPTATPWPTPTPSNYNSFIGSRLEGEQGILDIWNLQKEDKSTYLAYKLSSNTEAGFLNSFWQINLEGAATEELGTYYHMPIKVWGAITNVNSLGVPTIQLERFEPAYSDEKPHLWFGTEKSIQLEGRKAVIFTADDGTSYVTDDSIQNDQEPVVPDKDWVLYIAGWSNPSETYNGYPVIHVMSIGTAPRDHNFDTIISDALTPPIVNASDVNFSGEPQTGIINHVELIYQGEDQLLAQPEEGRVLYAQPFWHFSGYYSENSFFTIIVQALPDEYLSSQSLQ